MAKIAVLDVLGKHCRAISKSGADSLLRGQRARKLRPGVIQLLPEMAPLRSVDFLPRTDRSIPKTLPPSEVHGCVFEDPGDYAGRGFLLMAARNFCRNHEV